MTPDQKLCQRRKRKARSIKNERGLAPDIFAEKRRRKRNKGDKKQKDQIAPDQSRIECFYKTKDPVVLKPHHTDDKKTVNKSQELSLYFPKLVPQCRLGEIFGIDVRNFYFQYLYDKNG